MKVIKIRGAQASKLSECANKAYKASKKLMEFIEDEILDSESMDERNGGSGMGGGNFRDEDDDDDEWEDDEDMNKRRGVPGTGRYGRGRYRRGRY
jgi:hypothetical protein